MNPVPNSRHDQAQSGQRARVCAVLGVLGVMLLTIWLSGCTHLGQFMPFGQAEAAPAPRPIEPAPIEETSDQEEAGVQHLRGLLRCFDAGLQQQQFAAAEDCLHHAERGSARANSLTRSHPDFDDLAETIKAGRARYVQAIERDRLVKRDLAIDALLARGELAYNLANILCLGAAQAPSADALAELDASEKTLAELLRAGEGFMDVPRYDRHAQQLKAVQVAVHAASQAAFRATCRGDEATAFARWGRPERIDSIGDGRVFVYGPHRRIAFDSEGRQTEETTLHP